MSTARTQLISQLLPIISGFRHSQNIEARNYAALLQLAVRDLERLNDIEMLCRQATDSTGPTLWLKFIELLERE